MPVPSQCELSGTSLLNQMSLYSQKTKKETDVLPVLDLNKKTLQENTHQHQHQRKVGSSSLCEKRHYKGVCGQRTGTM